MPVLNMQPVPTGGAVVLHMPQYLQPSANITQITLSRAVMGATGLGAFTTFYQGPPIPTYVDAGDGTPGPLSSITTYVWRVQDIEGTAQTSPYAPRCQIISNPDALTQLLIRLLQGAVNSTTLPAGIQRPQLTIEFPQNGWQALPLIVVNLELIQQTEVQIGEDAVNPDKNLDWTLWVNAKRVWRITVFSQDAAERDYFRDMLLMSFRVLKASAFQAIGLNVSHSFQAHSYTETNETEGKAPGFYAADLMLDLNGFFNTAIMTNFGIIRAFDVQTTVLPEEAVFTFPEQLSLML